MSGNGAEFKRAVENLFREMMTNMPEDEIRAMLEAHKDGDIAIMIRETGALEIWRKEMSWFERPAGSAPLTIDEEIKANYKAFNEKLPELLVTHKGKFALMHETEIVEFFDTAGDACLIGLKQYPDHFFSIQEVTDVPVYRGWAINVTVKAAREAMARAFKNDPDFRRAYVDNVACILMDRLSIKDKGPRDAAADEIIRILFEKDQIQ